MKSDKSTLTILKSMELNTLPPRSMNTDIKFSQRNMSKLKITNPVPILSLLAITSSQHGHLKKCRELLLKISKIKNKGRLKSQSGFTKTVRIKELIGESRESFHKLEIRGNVVMHGW